MVRKSEQLRRGIVKDKGTYRVRVTYEGVRYSLGNFDTLASAEAAQDKAKGEIAVKMFVPPNEERATRQQAREARDRGSVTLRAWSERWLNEQRQQGRSESTIVSRQSVLRAHVLGPLGDVPLSALTEERLDDFMAGLTVSASVRRNIGLCLRACLNAAVKAKVIAISPYSIPVKDAPRSAGKVVSTEDIARLSDAMPPALSLAVMLGAWCQMRLGEVLGLQRRDFDLVAKVPNVTIDRQLNSKTSPPSLTPPKAGSERTMALHAAMVPLIGAHLSEHVGPEPSAPVFAGKGSRSGHLSQSAFDRAYSAARRATGLDGVRFHDLRHSGLTYFAQAGGTLADIMRRGGHKDVKVAMRYQHAALEREQALMNSLPIGRAK